MRLRAMFLGFLIAGLCLAQETPVDTKPTEIIQWSIAPEVVHKNIHFILDKSGSMNADQLTSAMSCFLYIAEQSVDEINIAITIFGENSHRWEGVPDENTPKGWASLPSRTGLEAAKKWVAETTLNSSSTNVRDAFRRVDREIIAKPRNGNIDDVTVIVISDLVFDQFPGSITESIAEIRREREKNECGAISFGFIGIYPNPPVLERQREVCEQTGCWLAFIEKPAEEEEELPPAILPDPDPPPLPDPPFPH